MSRLRAMMVLLRARYGLGGTVFIVVASAVLLLVPFPGMAFLPLALAEVLRKVHHHSTRRPVPVPVPANKEELLPAP